MTERAFVEKDWDLAMCNCNAAAPGCSTPQQGFGFGFRRRWLHETPKKQA
jgi:hypothetical protein